MSTKRPSILLALMVPLLLAGSVARAQRTDRAALESRFHALRSEDEEFVPVLREIQKVYFRERAWNRFFANAAFYRKRILGAEVARPGAISSRLIALEMIALAKHCRWDEARLLGQASLPLATDDEARAEITRALDYLTLAHEFPPSASAAPAPAEGAQLWKLKGTEWERIPHPKFLRLEVESRCVP